MSTPSRPSVPEGPFLIAGLGRAGQAAGHALVGGSPPREVHAWDGAARAGSVRGAARGLRRRGATVSLGGDGVAALDAAGPEATVVKSPGMSLDAPLLRAAGARELEVMDELELGWRLSRAPLVGVTGTNGKSTTCALVHRVLKAAGERPLLVGNTEWGPPLSAAARHDGWLVCEVSSFQLARAPCLLPEVAVFTNLTAEHLTWHGDMEAYAAAKRRLFVRGERAAPVCVVNADDSFGAELAADAEAAGGRVLRHGCGQGADVRIEHARWSIREATVRLLGPGGAHEIATFLPGMHNARNVAGAFAAAVGLGVDPAAAAGALSGATPPPGRWEVIDEGQDFELVVDYAHTPDGLRQALDAARTAAESRACQVHAVFGPVGVPDAEKARGSGRVLHELADHLVLTTGSAPGQPRLVRIAELLHAGPGRARVEIALDRRAAIDRAVAAARPGDVVAVLGIGALSALTLDSRGTRMPFDDREAARASLRAL